MTANQTDLAAVLTVKPKKTLSESTGDTSYGVLIAEWFFEALHSADKRIAATSAPASTAAFMPGCVVFFKPSDLKPLSVLAMALLAERAGAPTGLFTIANDDATANDAVLKGSPTLVKLTVTGSTKVGGELLQQCTPTSDPAGCGRGRNTPTIVFDSVDPDAAIKGAILSNFRCNGQTSVCANRINVQSDVYDACAQGSAMETDFPLANSKAEDMVMGLMVDTAAVSKVTSHVTNAKPKGVSAALGGNLCRLGRAFYDQTILPEGASDREINTEVTFKPLAPLFILDTEIEVVVAANDTETGLASDSYSLDTPRILRVSEALENDVAELKRSCVNRQGFAWRGQIPSSWARRRLEVAQ